MTYKLDFLEEALAEWNKLNPSIKQPLKKQLIKVLQNPRIPKNKLSGYPNRQIKLRSISYRLVYEVVDDEVVVIVIAVGRRENNAVYDDANSRHS